MGMDQDQRKRRITEKRKRNKRRRRRGRRRRLSPESKIIGIGFFFLCLFIGVLILNLFQESGDEGKDRYVNPLDRIQSIQELEEKTKEACILFLRIAEDEGLNVKITETYRTKERQEFLYAQGRTREGKVVTWTLKSKHMERNAFDIAKNDQGHEYDDLEFFKKAAEIGESIGLEAGYYWTNGQQDMPHFQMNFLSRLKYPEKYKK